MAEPDIAHLADQLAELLERKLSIHKRGDLAAQLSHLGRRAPRRVRRSLQLVAEAETMARDPRLQPRIDRTEVERAHRIALHWLSEVDPAARRWRQWRAWAASLSFGLLLMAGLLITALAISGRIGPGAAP